MERSGHENRMSGSGGAGLNFWKLNERERSVKNTVWSGSGREPEDAWARVTEGGVSGEWWAEICTAPAPFTCSGNNVKTFARWRRLFASFPSLHQIVPHDAELSKARFQFKHNRLCCVRCVSENRKKRKSNCVGKQPIIVATASTEHSYWLALANCCVKSACVSCGFRLRNARNASVWMEAGLNAWCKAKNDANGLIQYNQQMGRLVYVT